MKNKKKRFLPLILGALFSACAVVALCNNAIVKTHAENVTVSDTNEFIFDTSVSTSVSFTDFSATFRFYGRCSVVIYAISPSWSWSVGTVSPWVIAYDISNPDYNYFMYVSNLDTEDGDTVYFDMNYSSAFDENTVYITYYRFNITGGGYTEEDLQEAYNEGLSEGMENGYERGYNEGYYEGNIDGYEDGISESERELQVGLQNAYDRGFDKGYTNGSKEITEYYEGSKIPAIKEEYKDIGYDIGYQKALEADKGFYSLLSGIMDAPISMIKNVLDFDIMGVNIGGAIFGLLSILIIAFVIRKVI